jgi:hypothetical protein
VQSFPDELGWYPDGSPAEDLYGLSLGGGHFLGTGNPGDEGKDLGVAFTMRRTDKSTSRRWFT